MTSASGLLDIKTYADVVAPPTRSIIHLALTDACPHPRASSPISRSRPARPRLVFRPENNFIAADFRNGAGDTARIPKAPLPKFAGTWKQA